MGHNYVAAGELEQAASYFGRSSRHSRNAGNIFAMASAVHELARIRQQQGQLLEAEAACLEALALADKPEYAGWPAFCLVHVALADVLLGLNRLDEAEAHLHTVAQCLG